MARCGYISSTKKRGFGIVNEVFDWRSWQFTSDAWKRSSRRMRIVGFSWGWFGIGFVWGWREKGESDG